MTLLLLLSFVYISACSQQSSDDDKMLLGGNRDVHGCIASAGYSWCPRTEQCEQSWELAEQEGFHNTEQAFQEFCRQVD